MLNLVHNSEQQQRLAWVWRSLKHKINLRWSLRQIALVFKVYKFGLLVKIDTTIILFVSSEYVLKLILCMSSSFIFLPNVKQPKYDDKSWENRLKSSMNSTKTRMKFWVEFTYQIRTTYFVLIKRTRSLQHVYL